MNRKKKNSRRQKGRRSKIVFLTKQLLQFNYPIIELIIVLKKESDPFIISLSIIVIIIQSVIILINEMEKSK